MCGISGFIDFSKTSSQSILEKMNRTLAHRGPDGEGYAMFTTNNAIVGLGHRRLSIIDLSPAGSQPKAYKHFHITFNGEIYNYEEIKKELAAKGHQFNSHSDTEVVLHAYEEWGSKCLDKFIGMFAFVIYDEQKQKIFACRDRAGVKPFNYYSNNDVFVFASELKAIVEHPKFEKKINLDAVAAFMQYAFIPTPHCIYQNTYKLKPGHFLEFDLGKKEIITKQYWNVYDAYNKPILTIDFNEAKQETEKILKKAFDYRMVSDVPVGVFLSGGYDSACVTALLQKDRTDKIKTFTIGVPDAGLNEAPYAKDVATHLGTDHTEYYCTQKEALEIIPQLPFFYDEPFADSSAIPTSLVSKIAREKVIVALSADAGDEIFAGYNRYDYALKFGKRLQQIPGVFRKTLAALMNAIPSTAIPLVQKKYLFHSRYEKIKNFLQNPSEKNILKNITQQMTDDSIAVLMKHPVKVLPSAFDSEELNPENYSVLTYMMAIDYQTYMLDDILQKVDRATMSTSLEGREPFLDQSIIEWAAQLPIDYKYNKGQKKYILKEIVHDYIPKTMMDRPKMGFGIPIASWLQNELKPFVDLYFDEAFVEKQNIFNNEEVQKVKHAFYNGKTERAEKIWFLLMFQMWYDKWINNN
jgi:asparagine synthase (glutamine-hydrolysing)